MEYKLKVIIEDEEARLLIKGIHWLPSGDIDKDTVTDLNEVRAGQENLKTMADIVFRALIKEISPSYNGKLEFEVLLRIKEA